VTRRAGVLGHPIAHSLSPTLHRAAYAALELDWDYRTYDVDAGQLATFLEGVDLDWAGLSLTMPLKVEAVPLMDFVEPFAKLLGVVNTVLVGGRATSRQLVGANTDVHGIVSALAEGGVTRTEGLSAVVLGGGATAISALAALGQLGCLSPVVAVRSRARAGALLRAATAMGLSVRFVDIADAAAVGAALSHAQAVVSTIPADAGAQLAAAALSDASLASQAPASGAVLLDVVYNPPVTPLASAWRDAGGTVVGGERMLLHQAAEQVRLMTGQVAPLAAMDAALRDALAGQGS